MAGKAYESTITHNQTSSSGGAGTRLALRWVFPDPKRPPVWIDRALTFGRDAGVDVVLQSEEASRRHAQIQAWGPVWLLNDLDSKNGVTVNGARIKSHALTPGDVMRIGDEVAVVIAAPPNTDLSLRPLGDGVFGGFRHEQVLAELRTVANTELSVVLEGATGTGKDRFARLLHQLSARAGAYVAVNCSVYATHLAAAELFGYRKGAFTGADRPSAGHVRSAEGGTLFLDELPELPRDVQPMLLRAIENREVLPVGETRALPVNVRFIAATQRPLAEFVERGAFRADLRARLEGAVVRLPELSECREIIPELFAELFSQHVGRRPLLSAGFIEALCLQPFSLNTRELNTLAQRVALAAPSGETLRVEALTRALNVARSSYPPTAEIAASLVNAVRPSTPFPGRGDGPYTREELEALREALERAKGNITRAATELGITRQRAYRMLERLRSP